MNNPVCTFCNKEMSEDVEIGDAMKVFTLFICNLCQAPLHDTMYKELMINRPTPNLVARCMFVDNFYVIWNHGYNLDGSSDLATIIYKDIVGTVAHSVHLYPITYHQPIVTLPQILQLPRFDINAILEKLKIYTTFS